jgi:3-deoxy-D-manno-octulosonic-acid transferase
MKFFFRGKITIIMRFFLYQLLIHILIVLSPIKFIYRSIKQPDYLKHLAERYGVYNLKNIKNNDLIWFHCVSLGETKAINSLLSHLVPKFKDKYFLVTHSTPTGRNTEIYKSKRIFRAYLCFDSWFLNKLFLNYFKPKVAIFLETEIWPGITKELKFRKIPSLLINARLSDKSLAKYQHIKYFIKQTFDSFDLIIAQSEHDKNNFKSITDNKIQICSNLKFNQFITELTPSEKNKFKKLLNINSRKVISLISSRKGEEELFLKQIKLLKNFDDFTFMIIPRHPQRFKEVEALILKDGYACNLASNPKKTNQSNSIVLGNTMGEMNKYISISDLVLIGGSFKNFGSQSPVESLLLKTPCLVGPSIYNFLSIIQHGIAAKVIKQIAPDAIAVEINNFFKTKNKKVFEENLNKFLLKNKKDEEKVIQLISKYF